MVEIPEHLLKRSREAMAKAKAAKGEPVEEEPSPPESAETEAEPGVAEEAPAAQPPPVQEAPLEMPPAAAEPTPGAAAASAVPAPSGGYPPEDLVEGTAGIKEVASSRAPGWIIAAFVIIPVVSLIYMTQFSRGVQCGQAGTLQVAADGSLETCEGKPLPSPGTGGRTQEGPDGEEIYARRCAACHGPRGEGGVGTPLNKDNGTKLLENFPDAAAQIDFVSKGNQAFPQGWGKNSQLPKGVMPAFGETLSPEEIKAVVAFERSLAGEAAPGGP